MYQRILLTHGSARYCRVGLDAQRNRKGAFPADDVSMGARERPQLFHVGELRVGRLKRPTSGSEKQKAA
jgi:hypothetical protein